MIIQPSTASSKSKAFQRGVVALVSVLLCLFAVPSNCGFHNVLASRPFGPLCGIEGYVELTQLWINIGIIYIALFDHALLRDILWPMVLAVRELVTRVSLIERNVTTILSELRATRSRQPQFKEEAPDAPPPHREPEQPKANPAEDVYAPRTIAHETVAPPLDQPHSASGRITGIAVICLNVAAVLACIIALSIARPAADVAATATLSAPEATPAATIRIVGLGARPTCWQLARLCTGSGTKWVELREVNRTLVVVGNLCVVHSHQELNVPQAWQCPAALYRESGN